MVRHKNDRNVKKGGNLLYRRLSVGVIWLKKGEDHIIQSAFHGVKTDIYSHYSGGKSATCIQPFSGVGGGGQGEKALYNTGTQEQKITDMNERMPFVRCNHVFRYLLLTNNYNVLQVKTSEKLSKTNFKITYP